MMCVDVMVLYLCCVVGVKMLCEVKKKLLLGKCVGYKLYGFVVYEMMEVLL